MCHFAGICIDLFIRKNIIQLLFYWKKTLHLTDNAISMISTFYSGTLINDIHLINDFIIINFRPPSHPVGITLPAQSI